MEKNGDAKQVLLNNGGIWAFDVFWFVAIMVCMLV